MVRKGEFIGPSQFHIEVDEPEEIYQALLDKKRKIGSNRDGELVPIGSTISRSGLFYIIDAVIAIPPSTTERFFPAICFKTSSSRNAYWQQREIDATYNTLAKTYGPNTQKAEVFFERFITLDDPLEQTRYFVDFGCMDEKTRWRQQLEFADRKARAEKDPKSKKEIENEVRQLVTSLRPNREDDMFISMDRIDQTLENPIEKTGMPLKDEVDFIRKMAGFVTHAERIISAIAQVKEVPQTGILTLHPPIRG